MLHIITNSPFHSQSLQTCLRYSSHEDEIVLMQDAVYAGLYDSVVNHSLQSWSGKLYLLDVDVQARGIISLLDEKCELLTTAEYVALTVKHQQQIHWQ
ncbi:sulfurtransferase complex subunit TusB [Thaumasiovibrio sp. DFM-14]|uniref:sulfurtransferase complex subunit TusB n=1 Tax=Thaumasiovibrio sp. DFM-14 TaxID=3384792 RepID=UPI00399F2020